MRSFSTGRLSTCYSSGVGQALTLVSSRAKRAEIVPLGARDLDNFDCSDLLAAGQRRSNEVEQRASSNGPRPLGVSFCFCSLAIAVAHSRAMPWLLQRPLEIFPPDSQGRNLMYGDVASVSERHISYLIRQWEVNRPEFDPQQRSARVHKSVSKFEPAVPYSQIIVGVLAALVFCVVWIPMEAKQVLTPVDRVVIAFAAAHVTLYILVFASTSGFAMFRAWSFVDGLNSVTRFTVKLDNDLAGLLPFHESFMPSSISSSVSTRGTTLNKLMIGVSYSLSVGLFVKFVQFGSLWTHFIAFSYLFVIFTGMYEVRRSSATRVCARVCAVVRVARCA